MGSRMARNRFSGTLGSLVRGRARAGSGPALRNHADIRRADLQAAAIGHPGIPRPTGIGQGADTGAVTRSVRSAECSTPDSCACDVVVRLAAPEPARSTETDMQIDADPVAAERPSHSRRRPARQAPEFPGCRPIPLKREEVSTYDGHFEYWDGDAETAWVVAEPTSATHEQPSARLAGLGHVIAGVRGSPIECYGTMDLLLRNARGEKWRIMQADQAVVPASGARPAADRGDGDRLARPPGRGAGGGPHHRRSPGQAGLYEAWGFPEVWVDVPETGYAPSRPAGLSPGLTIHVLEDGGLPDSGGEPGVSGLDGGGDPHGDERSDVVDGNQPGAAPGGTGAGSAGGHRPPTTRHGCAWSVARPASKGNGRCWFARRRGGSAPGRRTGCPRRSHRIDDPARLAEVGDRIVDCATGADLLDRVEALASSA